MFIALFIFAFNSLKQWNQARNFFACVCFGCVCVCCVCEWVSERVYVMCMICVSVSLCVSVFCVVFVCVLWVFCVFSVLACYVRVSCQCGWVSVCVLCVCVYTKNVGMASMLIFNNQLRKTSFLKFFSPLYL